MATVSSIREKLHYKTLTEWYPEKEQMIIEWLSKCKNLKAFLEVHGHCSQVPDAPTDILDLIWKGMVLRCKNLDDFQIIYGLEDSNQHDEELLKKVDELCDTVSKIDNIIDMFPAESIFYQQLLQKRTKLTK